VIYSIVTPTSPCDDGYFGELLATSLVAHGVRGLIIDAGSSRRREVDDHGISRLVKGIQRAGHGERDARQRADANRVRGAHVRPGDVIVADDDGVVVVARENANEVLAAESRAKPTRVEKRQCLASANSASTSTTCARNSPSVVSRYERPVDS
jgi:4-hydroxy-4-methyl-2-oxoglutarate aldolase